ncbi:ADO1_4 [Sanghuangporus weigelae]
MAQTYPLFCMGNPLLDMQVTDGDELLKKYKLNANDAILAGEEQAEIYDDLVQNYKLTYVAGGASQNAARGAAYLLPPNSVVYTGWREGLTDAYLVKKGEKTGACAVVITVTTLRVAEKFEAGLLSSPEVAPLVEGAKVIYVEGYFLTHGLESILHLAKKASETAKIFVLNLSAPFITQFFKTQLDQPEASGQPDKKDLPAVARAIALTPKSNPSRPRTVIITQGPESTIVATAADDATPKIFPVHALKDEEIVDTNGAGDAFAGGVLGALVADKSIDEAIEVGHKMGAMCVQQVGPQYKWPKVQIL